jgi:hypothetical protein
MMRLRSIFIVSTLISIAVAAGVAWAASGRERSLAVYPAQRMPLTFSHMQHLEDGADCTTCHDPARKSGLSADLNLPKHPECESCHDIRAASQGKTVDPKSSCNTCHPGFDHTAQKEPARVDFPPPNLIFPHKVHVAQKVECSVCHGTMTDVTLATRMQLPKMETCLKCHDNRAASAECRTCHPTQPSGRLQLAFSSGLLRPAQGNPFGMDHGPRFEFTHGSRAALSRQMCSQCHAESECQQCHDSLQKPLSVHPNDFITLHPVQARMEMSRCESCHRQQSFCAACHERVGVGLDADPTLRPTNVRVHPDYATFVNNTGSPQHHGIQASRDLKQCIACHREESCMACHAQQGGPVAIKRQVNPHPTGFASICKALASKNDRACLKCHTEARIAQAGCR